MALGVAVAFAADDPCMNVKGYKWIADPKDCTTFFVCFNGLSMKNICPPNTVTDPIVQVCVPKGSRLDKCSEKRKPAAGQGKPVPFQAKPNVDSGKPVISQFTPHVDQGRPNGSGQTVLRPHTVCQTTGQDKLGHSNCAKYVDCQFGTPQVRECTYPQLYDISTKQCLHHDKVECKDRHEPKSPCDYESNKCDLSSHCVPCELRFPSCDGLEDGLNAWPGREWTPDYIVCYTERVTFTTICSQGISYVFDPQKRYCVEAKKKPGF